ncbi:MAG: hypothetical protein GY801_52335 [bacterium]|nr:hypothetical protein [bacterium]
MQQTQPQIDSRIVEFFDRPMRWAQLAFVDNDPGRFDPQFWLDYFKRTHSNATVLSAGGYNAYYPTNIPLHYRSAWMGNSDPFGEIVKGCREMDMVIVARTDPHAVHQDVYDAHPDWIAVTADGKPRRHWSKPDVWVTCALGPYNFEFMTEVNNEIVELYGVDAIFSNRWAGHGVCYCEHCQQNFADASGMELPRMIDANDPAWKAYIIWRQERLFELCRLWDSEIRKINPLSCFIPNAGGGALCDLDMKKLSEFVPILCADRQGRRDIMTPWAGGKNGKEYRAVYGNRPVASMTSVGIEEKYRWKDAVQSEAELQVWIAEGIANGMRPWFVKFCAVVHDERWLPVIEDVYKWHHRSERYLRNTRSLAKVAVVYSQQTARFYGGAAAHEKVEDHILGMYQALIEARIPFEMVHDGLLDAEHIDQFTTLILPNIAVLSDAQCEQLREYVKRGGNLVATFETSRYNERGELREDLGLADLFGVSVQGDVQGPLKNTYLRVDTDGDLKTIHPVLKGLETASRLIYGTQRLPVEATVEFEERPVTFVPPYPDLPMEEVYPRIEKTDIPEVYLRRIGESRVAFIPWDIDRIFWEVLNCDHGRLLANVVDWAAHAERPVTATGQGVIDVTVWDQETSMTVHLVNLTNPMMMRGPFRELISIGAQRVSIQVPADKTPKMVKLLSSGKSVKYQYENGCVRLIVPSILVHEVIAIDW